MGRDVRGQPRGTFKFVRARGPHVTHRDGYFLLTPSLVAAVHLPLMSPHCASNSAVESLGGSLRVKLLPTGACVGVAYYAELDADMTSRGFASHATARMPLRGHGCLPVSPVALAIDALERGITRRSRRIVSPRWAAAVLPIRELAQRVVELEARRGLAKSMEIAREERPELTTPQPRR